MERDAKMNWIRDKLSNLVVFMKIKISSSPSCPNFFTGPPPRSFDVSPSILSPQFKIKTSCMTVFSRFWFGTVFEEMCQGLWCAIFCFVLRNSTSVLNDGILDLSRGILISPTLLLVLECCCWVPLFPESVGQFKLKRLGVMMINGS